MGKKEADTFGIAPAVAKRLCEWADLEAKCSKERQEKFVERDGIADQIAECEDPEERKELAEQHFDVVKAIDNLAREIKHCNQQINGTLRDQAKRSQDVIDPDILGPLYAPKPEPKKHHDDDPDQGKLGDGYASAEAKPLGFTPEPMTEADAVTIGAYAGQEQADDAAWPSCKWNEEPIADAAAQPLKLEIRGKYVDRWDDVAAIASQDCVGTPTELFVAMAKAAKSKHALENYMNLRLAAFLLDRACRLHIAQPSNTIRDGLLAIGKTPIMDTIRAISPFAAAVYERERDLAGTGDGTDTAPKEPRGGSASQARKRDEAANRKAATKQSAGKKSGKSAGKTAKSRR